MSDIQEKAMERSIDDTGTGVEPNDEQIEMKQEVEDIEGEGNDNDYDEEEDDDYDPTAKNEDEAEQLDDDSEKEEPDYSAIGSNTTQVRTRNQRYQDISQAKAKETNIVGEVSNDIDFDAMFNTLKAKSTEGKPTDWKEILGDDGQDNDEVKDDTSKITVPSETNNEQLTDQPAKIWINTSYAFAGRVITESKQVDADSAEAKAYLNSTAGLQMKEGATQKYRAFVPVIRTIKGSDEPVELRIKLKRPSLIDKFLSTLGNKFQKLSTLEKSRLDWASFVDQNKINDELKSHNKDGYLEKQDFLGRVQANQDKNYESAREADRLRRWQDQQKQL